MQPTSTGIGRCIDGTCACSHRTAPATTHKLQIGRIYSSAGCSKRNTRRMHSLHFYALCVPSLVLLCGAQPRAPCDEQCRASIAQALCNELHEMSSTLHGADVSGSKEQASPDLRSPGLGATEPVNGTSLLFAPLFRPQLRPRAAGLAREFGCVAARPPPPLKAKRVEDGKSAMGFLVAGADAVEAETPASFSVIFKQLNPQEQATLPPLLPTLLRHYADSRGSILARYFAWARYVDADGKTFDAVMMENAVRPAPGVAPPPSAVAARAWRSFDMKGIRLYAHESRFAQLFGASGLHVTRSLLSRLSAAVQRDVDMLRRHQLVDYSYLLTAYPLSARASPRARLERGLFSATRRMRSRAATDTMTGREAERAYARAHGGLRGGGGGDGGRDSGGIRSDVDAGLTRSFSAFYCGGAAPDATFQATSALSANEFNGHGSSTQPARPSEPGASGQPAGQALSRADVSADGRAKTGAEAGDGRGANGASKRDSKIETAVQPCVRDDAAHERCYPVIVRVAVIDYLRQWSMAEVAEHWQKTLVRDLRAWERNHAVVPVDKFAAKFADFFTTSLFTPVDRPARRVSLMSLAAAARARACAAACGVHRAPRLSAAICHHLRCSDARQEDTSDLDASFAHEEALHAKRHSNGLLALKSFVRRLQNTRK
uniref:PIPK domain-containing protein n=1 Tax=Chrysotila carterae TaxID=13221 RepID=A0A7S4B529_CHRCT